MNVAAAVVRNRVGRSMMRAKPTQTTMKRTAPTSPMIRPASRANTTTVMVMTMKRPRGKPVRAIWDARNDYRHFSSCFHDGCERCLTASAGFSVANLDILAMSSFRFSGGNMLSSHADPWFNMPPTDPCSPPAMPLIASAIAVIDEDILVGEGVVLH